MNIAILIPSLAGGGAERVASMVGNHYIAQGHKVYYFVGDYGVKPVYNVQGKIVQTGIKPYMNDGFISIISMILSSIKMRQYKKKYEIDISISFMEEFNYLNILSKGKDKVYVRVCTILSERQEWKRSILLNKHMLHFFYNLADKVIVMSQYGKRDMLVNYGINKERITIIPNAVNIVEARNDIQYKKNRIICVARIDTVKQLNVAIRAFSEVVKRITDAELIILGDGPKRKELEVLVRKLNIEEHVIFMGFQKYITEYLQESKLFLMTSKVEGFPNSMIEAMAQGVPIVTINSPGAISEILKYDKKEKVNEIIYCLYGVLVPYINNEYMDKERITYKEKLLADAIIEIMSNEKLQEKYVKASLMRADRFKQTRVLKSWDKLIYK